MLALPPSAAAAEDAAELDELAALAALCALAGVQMSEVAAKAAITKWDFMTVSPVVIGRLALYKM